MQEFYCLFMKHQHSGLVEKCFRFADVTSMSMYLAERNPKGRDIFQTPAQCVGSRSDEFVFIVLGWSCFAEMTEEPDSGILCWAFSSPVLGSRRFFDWDDLLKEIRLYNEKWEEKHI